MLSLIDITRFPRKFLDKSRKNVKNSAKMLKTSQLTIFVKFCQKTNLEEIYN